MTVWGWDSYVIALFVCGVLGALILLPLWSVRTNPKEAGAEPASA